MDERNTRIPLSWENGLFEGQEDSMLPDGFAATLENWVPEPGGGVRCRRGWTNGSTTSAPATRKVRGIGYRGFTARTPRIVQSVTGSEVTTGNVSATWSQATTAGNLLLCVITSAHPTNNAAGTAAPAGWTSIFTSGNATASGSAFVGLFYKANASSESGAVTAATTSSSLNWRMTIMEVSGITTSSPFDVSQEDNTNSGTTIDSGTTASTTQANEFVIAAFAVDTATSSSSFSNSFTERADASHHHIATKTVSSLGTQSTAMTIASAADYAVGVIATFKIEVPTVNTTEYLTANDNGSAYVVYYADDPFTGAWGTAETVTASDRGPMMAFSEGLSVCLYSNQNMSTIRYWDGATAASIASSPAGRTLAFHKNRFFSAGTSANPERLWYSDLGDYTTWGALSFIDVDQSGDKILDLAVFENGLLIAKQHKLHYLSGSGPDTFTVNPLNAGGGYPGRCIAVTPFGAVIAAERQVFLWAGGGVDVISQAIEDSYQLTGDFVTTAYINGICYITDEGTGTTYCLDMAEGKWWLEKTSNASTDGPAHISSRAGRLLYGPANSTTISLLAYRQEPGGSRARDASLAETFKVWTPELWPEGPDGLFTPIALAVKYRQRGTGSTGITVTPVYDGTAASTSTITAQATAGTYRKTLPIAKDKRGIRSAQFKFEVTIPSNESSAIEIEEVIFEYKKAFRPNA